MTARVAAPARGDAALQQQGRRGGSVVVRVGDLNRLSICHRTRRWVSPGLGPSALFFSSSSPPPPAGIRKCGGAFHCSFQCITVFPTHPLRFPSRIGKGELLRVAVCRRSVVNRLTTPTRAFGLSVCSRV